MLPISGIDLKTVQTKPAIPGIEFIVLKGRNTLITLKAEIPDLYKYIETHPSITIKQSSYLKIVKLCLNGTNTYNIPGITKV